MMTWAGKTRAGAAAAAVDTTERTPVGRELHGTGPLQELVIHWVADASYRERHVLVGPRIRIGRGSDCHLRLEHPSVSRAHAELSRQGPIYVLSDLGSTNGTRLNGRRAEHAAIAKGDVVTVGEFVGVVGALGASRSLDFGELAPGLFGGASLWSALATAKAAAASDIPIVLVGETGTGKERAAAAIHFWSGRSGRLHALNCSAVPVALAEAELFGYERGAFTGAERARPGHMRAAHGGTLFLDEVVDLPLPVQAKLLRAIENREVTPLGETASISIDVRIISALHEPLDRAVERKAFRADLCARLAGFQLELPPLRERREDIPGLFFHFLDKYGRGRARAVDARLIERLCTYLWPGNVRELELFVRKILVLYEEAAVLCSDMAEGMLPASPPEECEERVAEKFRDRREQDLHHLKQALAKSKGNMTEAAASVGISRRRAYRLLASATPVPGGASSEE